MLALTLAISLQLGAAEARPEAWVVVSRRSGVAKPQALELARNFAAALNERGVPTPTPVDDASSCNAKVPCLVDLAQKKGVAVLVTLEAGSALDDLVLHVEALSVEEFGKKMSTFDFTGSPKELQTGLKDKVEEFFAPAVRNVLGLATPAVARANPPPEEPKPAKAVEPPPAPVESKPVVAAATVTESSSASGMSTTRVVGLVAMGVGAALLITAAGFGIKTLGTDGERKGLCPPGMPCTDPKAYSLYSSAGSTQSAGVGLLVAGLVVAAAGVAAFVMDFGGGSSATVAPSASSDVMGFALVGKF
ncbi:MAG: hypothetical protein IPJ65_31510 [Archangiaceae bacterium]|nr:hypothetical protein [Archangiaceae bacterium]